MDKTTFPKMHVGLKVRDLHATIKFYTALFGCEPTKIEDKYTKFMLEEPPLVISFSEKPEAVNPDDKRAHYGFQVASPEELAKKFMEVKERGLEVYNIETGARCCFALQDKFWVKDPDGLLWEIYYFYKDVKENDHYQQDIKVTSGIEM